MDEQHINITDVYTATTPLTTHIKSLCESSCKIRNNICSLLSKPNFNDIVTSDMCGQGKTKVTKQYLAENIIHLTKSIDIINKALNPVFECQTLSESLNNICDINNNQLQSDLSKQLVTSSALANAVEDAMKQHKTDIETKLGELCNVVNNLTVGHSPSSPNIINQFKLDQNSNGDIKITAPEPAYVTDDYKEEFITTEEEKKLLDFLANVNFTPEKGHWVKNFGAKYRYLGAGDTSSDD